MNASIVESARGKKKVPQEHCVFVANISRRVARCTEDWLISNYTDIAMIAAVRYRETIVEFDPADDPFPKAVVIS